MIKRKKQILILGFFLALSITLNFVSSSGVVTPYWDSNPLQISPGQSTTVTLTLQNMAGEQRDIVLVANITDGSDIAQIIDSKQEYNVPFGTENTPVNVKITIPTNYEIGSLKKVVISFQDKPSSQGGMVQVAGSFTTKIPVSIVGKEKSSINEKKNFFMNNLLIPIILVILIILTIIFIVKKKKHASPNKAKKI